MFGDLRESLPAIAVKKVSAVSASPDLLPAAGTDTWNDSIQRRPLGGDRSRLPWWQRKRPRKLARKTPPLTSGASSVILTEAKDGLASPTGARRLGALLTFHPETALTPGQRHRRVPVQPRAVRACARASAGDVASSLAQLVAAGLVIRRDSPNGKRYAGEGRGADRTGLRLRPYAACRPRGRVRAPGRRGPGGGEGAYLLREEISLHRRDIAKTIATAIEEELPGPWQASASGFASSGACRRARRTARA